MRIGIGCGVGYQRQWWLIVFTTLLLSCCCVHGESCCAAVNRQLCSCLGSRVTCRQPSFLNRPHRLSQLIGLAATPCPDVHFLIIDRIPVPTILRDDLANLPNLHQISINHAGLRSWNFFAFRDLRRLSVVDFSHNAIVEVKANWLRFLTNCSKIDLSSNNMRRIDGNALGDGYVRRKLDLKLDDNSLIVFPEQLASRIQPGVSSVSAHIRLEDNPIKCDCDMSYLPLTSHQSLHISGKCSADSLPELAGMDFSFVHAGHFPASCLARGWFSVRLLSFQSFLLAIIAFLILTFACLCCYNRCTQYKYERALANCRPPPLNSRV